MFSTDDTRRPRILVFAGPNGSGKCTITKNIPLCGLYINADEIKRISGCSDLEAAQEAEQLRECLLASDKDFTFETVLSTERNLKLLERARKKGYEIFAVFVLTRNISINIHRFKIECRRVAMPCRKKKSSADIKNLLLICPGWSVLPTIRESSTTPKICRL